mgnify:CR=1 FL=1
MFKKQLIHASKLAIRRSPFAPLLRKYFRSEPHSKAINIGINTGWDNAAEWLLSEAGRQILSNQQFLNTLKDDINTDIHIELLLTSFRKKLLIDNLVLFEQPHIYEMICALIKQCINNEFVWFVSNEEKKLLSKYFNLFKEKSSSDEINWTHIALIAMYEPLEKLLYKDTTKETLLQNLENVPEPIKQLLDSTLSDYEQEVALKKSIESFGSIQRHTSRIIAKNYEDYPYPRWIKWDFPKSGQRMQRLREFFDDGELSFLNNSFNVLVAGCGTGSKAIEYAIGYGNKAQILAIDLSAASLAYASRMAKEYQLTNIKFLQMDILDLPMLDQQFDIVECTGVLHHMQDPAAGAEAIISRVRTNGIVHISLYSELARLELAKLREDYNLRADMSNDDIRERRSRILQERAATIENKICLRWDFFDLYRCKDLLFHPLEHLFTIPQIGRMLDALYLEFRGLEAPSLISTQYWTQYPSKKDLRDLKSWHNFEVKNPDAFANLYEIWAKKIT